MGGMLAPNCAYDEPHNHRQSYQFREKPKEQVRRRSCDQEPAAFADPRLVGTCRVA